jgi:hypothetical protein
MTFQVAKTMPIGCQNSKLHNKKIWENKIIVKVICAKLLFIFLHEKLNR